MTTFSLLFNVFKLRIGFAIMLSAVAGMAVTPGAMPGIPQMMVLALAVLLSSASAGAFNQYAERELDARMLRTRRRPFASGQFSANHYWPTIIVLLLLLPVAATALVVNWQSALYVFLGAFVYGVVYTVWLKQRSWLNIVVGGLAGSFAVLAGAAAVAPDLAPTSVILAIVLFLWTPPHFWSLAFVFREDYARAGVPMLPVIVSARTAAWIILIHSVALVGLSLLPFWYGLGWIYLIGAVLGGVYFVSKSIALVKNPVQSAARANFRASLLQLSLLLLAAIVDSGFTRLVLA